MFTQVTSIVKKNDLLHSNNEVCVWIVAYDATVSYMDVVTKWLQSGYKVKLVQMSVLVNVIVAKLEPLLR